MRSYLTLLSILICYFSNAQYFNSRSESYENNKSLNGNWKFLYQPVLNPKEQSNFHKHNFDESNFENIKVPGSWETQGFANPSYAGKLKEGTGLYRRNFKIPLKWINKNIFIVLDGVCFGYDLWINENFVGNYFSSFNRRVIDISKYVVPGKDNLIAIKVSTRTKGWEFDTNDDWSLSGIIRDVNIFATPKKYISDFTINTEKRDNTGEIDLDLEISGTDQKDNISIVYSIKDKNGSILNAGQMTSSINKTENNNHFKVKTQINNPIFWSAEIPYLYTLEIKAKVNNNSIDSIKEKFGIREINTENGIFKINDKPVKLKGICHHELSLENGRYMSKEEIRRDVILIKNANANFIRTSHYPASRYLVELCDSIGLYVMEEVPFGHGDEHLNDESYKDNLFERAYLTIKRDKNSPSIITWSVGNENRLTPLCIETGKYVQELDGTRPYCFPSVGSYFKTIKDNYPDFIPVIAPHYPSASTVNQYARELKKPIIFSEYAHSLGLDFDKMETIWEAMYNNERVAGGAVWHFFDQGVKKKSISKPDLEKFTPYVWIDSTTFIDHEYDKGTDGIVYADRTPQIDYWQVKSVYSPVKTTIDHLDITKGKNNIQIKSENLYDFMDLANLKMTWVVTENKTTIAKGSEKLNAPAKKTGTNSIIFFTADIKPYAYYLLKINYINKNNDTLKSQTFKLKNPDILSLSDISNGNFGKTPLLNNNKGISTIFQNNSQQTNLMPLLRMGRNNTLCTILLTNEKASEDSLNFSNGVPWNPHMIQPIKIDKLTETNSLKSFSVYYSREKDSTQKINGTVTYANKADNILSIEYEMLPKNAKGLVLETGIGFLLPKSFTELRWIGMGPFPSYPGKSALSEYGIFHLNSEDLNFQGNYANVDFALLTDKNGNGIALNMKGGNLFIEKTENGMMIGSNAIVSGKFNKKSNPETKFEAEKIKSIKGEFEIAIITENWPTVFRAYFGDPKSVRIPFKPFYHSYDQ